MGFKFYQETTKDYSVEYRVPLHTYVLNEQKQCVGYIKEGQEEVRWFNSPMKSFDKRKRTFKNVTKKYSKKEVL